MRYGFIAFLVGVILSMLWSPPTWSPGYRVARDRGFIEGHDAAVDSVRLEQPPPETMLVSAYLTFYSEAGDSSSAYIKIWPLPEDTTWRAGHRPRLVVTRVDTVGVGLILPSGETVRITQ